MGWLLSCKYPTGLPAVFSSPDFPWVCHPSGRTEKCSFTILSWLYLSCEHITGEILSPYAHALSNSLVISWYFSIKSHFLLFATKWNSTVLYFDSNPLCFKWLRKFSWNSQYKHIQLMIYFWSLLVNLFSVWLHTVKVLTFLVQGFQYLMS